MNDKQRSRFAIACLAFIAFSCVLVGRKCMRETPEHVARPRAPAGPGEFEPRTAEEQARCGPRPALSPLDGELVGAERFLTRDRPGSVDVHDCTNPIFLDGHTPDCWRSTCSVRGANGVDDRVTFLVDANGIQRSEGPH